MPLAAAGYAVTAIEPSQPMMDVLLEKARVAGVAVESRIGRMQECALPADYDIALCLFTTISYLLDEDSLAAGLRSASAALKNGGRLLIDVPEHVVFRSCHAANPVLDRRIEVAALGDDLYRYSEQNRCFMDGTWHEYQDAFSIRYWAESQVLAMLREQGIECAGLHLAKGPIEAKRSSAQR